MIPPKDTTKDRNGTRGKIKIRGKNVGKTRIRAKTRSIIKIRGRTRGYNQKQKWNQRQNHWIPPEAKLEDTTTDINGTRGRGKIRGYHQREN